ncbi:MAG: hypothetical protein NT069_29975 [Planctomycetota bacterium]|nr:hypothetical protein [Planctomycetota bacterium]
MVGTLRLLITDRAWPDVSIERQILEPLGIEIVEATATDEATLCAAAGNVDAIACNWAPVTARVIESAPPEPELDSTTSRFRRRRRGEFR